MVKIPPKTDSGTTSREACIEKFKEWWTAEELPKIISKINPNIIKMFSVHGEKISNPDRLAEILYDTVGPRFLRNIENDAQKRQLFLESILKTVIRKKFVAKSDIINAAKSVSNPSKRRTIKNISDVVKLGATPKWCLRLATELGLPPSVAEKESVESLPDTEVIEPHSPLNPLYDYQYSTSLFVRGMLEGKNLDEKGMEIKRKLIAVPTGSGKTRMIVETMVEWLNDGKPSKNSQQKDSKFILWVAQSGELCEQALSTFRSVFESFGRRGTILRLHRFWGPGGSLPKLGMNDLLDEKGVIIATIQSLHKILINQPSQLENLSAITSCIIIDEAHHSVADSYSNVLRKMGFNWDNRVKEISELGIILIGLTATPFRGSGNNQETERLERRYNGVYFPTIPYSEGIENYKPHALVDCQTFAYTNEYVRILGERSYDRDGFIKDADYSWKIIKQKRFIELYSKDKDNPHQDEWTFEKAKNITFRFPEPGEYKIILKVVDNEGDSDTATSFIQIRKQSKESKVDASEKQKQLYHKLIQRKVLCDVYHKILQSECIELSSSDAEHMEKFGEFKKETLKQIGNNFPRNKMILSEIHELKKLGKKKILFFGCSVEHSRAIAMFLKTLYGMKVRYVDSKTDTDSRVGAIEQFRSGDLEVLCNFDVLTTGFDAPNVDCVFVGRPIKSTLLYTQMIGRGMRGTKSGGTEDVVIVDIDDNFQLQDNSSDPSITELGWKIFQEYWKPWDDSGEEIEPESKHEPKEIPVILTHSCSKCGNIAEGIESIKKVFGIEGPVQTLIEYLETKNYDVLPSKCHKCRISEETGVEEAVKPDEPFVEYLTNQANTLGTYEMVLGLYAITSQERNESEGYQSNLADAVEFLRKHNPDKASAQITSTHPVFDVYLKRGLIKEINDDSGKLLFERIQNIPKVRRLCNKKIQEYLLNEELVEKPTEETVIVKEFTSEKIDKEFEHLRDKVYGHIPTTRQFNESVNPEIKQILDHLYGSYSDYLKAKGLSVMDEPFLEDNLFDEYFELYEKVKQPISKEMLNDYGEYRIEDYEECFRTFGRFENIADELVVRMENLNANITPYDLHHDYAQIIEALGIEPHFEQVRKMSYLGMEYYVGLFGSLGKFKRITNSTSETFLLQNLLQDFMKIRHLLKIIPNSRQMVKYSQSGHKLAKIFPKPGSKFSHQADYEKFLLHIGVYEKPIEDPIPDSLKKEMRQKFVLEFEDNVMRFKRDKAMDLFLDADPIPYIEWFGSKAGFVEALGKIDGTYPELHVDRQGARSPRQKDSPKQKKILSEKLKKVFSNQPK